MLRRPPQRTPDPLIRFLDEPAPRVEPAAARPAGPPPPRPEPAAAPNPPAAPAPRRRREFPMGTLAFLAVVGAGLVMHRGEIVGPGRVRMADEVAKSVPVDGTPKIVVDTFNGPIEVTRGGTSTVDCLVVRQGSGPDQRAALEDARRTDVTIDRDGGTVTVSARRPGGFGRSGAAVKVRVPEGSTVKLKTTNGPISVQGVDGPVEARATNGRIKVEDASGAVALATTNGPISCEAADAVLNVESTNGSIEFHGSLAPGESLVQTTNGRVKMRLPEAQSFRLDARASNGKVETEFDLRDRQERPRRLTGTAGDDPKAVLKVRTTNGGVKILEED